MAKKLMKRPRKRRRRDGEDLAYKYLLLLGRAVDMLKLWTDEEGVGMQLRRTSLVVKELLAGITKAQKAYDRAIKRRGADRRKGSR